MSYVLKNVSKVKTGRKGNAKEFLFRRILSCKELIMKISKISARFNDFSTVL